jgi:hypothetical protein
MYKLYINQYDISLLFPRSNNLIFHHLSAEQLEATLEALMQEIATVDAQRLRDLLSQIAFAAASNINTDAEIRGVGKLRGDEEEDGSSVVIDHAKGSAVNPARELGQASESKSKSSGNKPLESAPVCVVMNSFLRLRTRVFAAELLGRSVACMMVEAKDLAEHIQVKSGTIKIHASNIQTFKNKCWVLGAS